MLQSAPPHLRHFIVHLENTMWCTSMPKGRRSLHGCRRCLGKELLLPSMALIGSARNGNQDLVLSLSTNSNLDLFSLEMFEDLAYVLVGDYYLPALKLPRTRPIGRWGMLHKAYLKLRKPADYQSLLLSGKLDTVLANVEEQAVERYEVLIEQLSQREGISEKLKEENQMEWVRRMRNLENRAAEIVKAELIYTFERR